MISIFSGCFQRKFVISLFMNYSIEFRYVKKDINN